MKEMKVPTTSHSLLLIDVALFTLMNKTLLDVKC